MSGTSYKSVTSVQLLADIRKNPNRTFRHLQITDELDIDQEKLNYLMFEDCVFDESVFISGNLGSGAGFISCIFNKLIFRDVTAKYKHISPTGINSSLTFNNSQIRTLEIYESKLERGIQILNDTQIDTLIVTNLQSTSNSALMINDSKISKQLDLTFFRSKGNVDIRRSDIICFTRLEDIAVTSLVIQDAKFNRLYVWGSTFTSNLGIERTDFSDKLEFTGNNFSSTFGLYDSTFKKEFIVNNYDKNNSIQSHIKHYFIRNCNFESGFHALDFKPDFHPDVTILFSNSLKGNIIFENINFKNSNITGHNNNLSLTFNNCKFNSIKLEDVTNNQTIRFSQCKANREIAIPSEFIINRSNIGKTNFLNVDFSSFEKISIIDSFISDIQFASITWFKKEQLTNLDSHNRETYRQLKFAAEKSGDNITALEFKSNELYFYQNIIDSSIPQFKPLSINNKVLKDKKGTTLKVINFVRKLLKYDELDVLYIDLKSLLNFPIKLVNYVWHKMNRAILMKNFSYEFGTKFILWLGRTTNNFGTNWIKPTIMILLGTLFFHIIISISLSPKLLWSLDVFNISGTFSVLSDYPSLYFHLLNPTHDLNRIISSQFFFSPVIQSVHWSVYALDMLHRIMYGFLLFQLIVAFRKFVK